MKTFDLTVVITSFHSEDKIFSCIESIEKTISLFEKTTKDFFNISERYSSSFEKLVHPVHTRGSVYGWLINF